VVGLYFAEIKTKIIFLFEKFSTVEFVQKCWKERNDAGEGRKEGESGRN
jgi:hypothetical protein